MISIKPVKRVVRLSMKPLNHRLIVCVLAPESDNSCSTPKGEAGECVPALECQLVRDLQSKYGRNVPRKIQHELRQLACNLDQRNVSGIICSLEGILLKLPPYISGLLLVLRETQKRYGCP